MYTFFISSLLLLSSFINTNNHIKHPTNKDYIIAFDLDDTLTQYTPFYKFKVFGYGLSIKDPSKSLKYVQALNAMRTLTKKRNKVPGNQDATYPEIIGGGFLQLTYAGIHEENLRPYIKGLIDLIWSNAAFKEGVPQLLTYLDEQGYELWIATNKDHISYTQIVENLEKRCAFKLSPLIKHNFVVWPTKETIKKLYTLEPRKESEFQELIDFIPTVHETGHIHHSHAPKPLPAYYEKMKQYAGTKKIIFFDDKKSNIEAAKKQGIKAYKVNNCSKMIEHLEKLNILNPDIDRKFYDTLNNTTLFKKILFWV